MTCKTALSHADQHIHDITITARSTITRQKSFVILMSFFFWFGLFDPFIKGGDGNHSLLTLMPVDLPPEPIFTQHHLR